MAGTSVNVTIENAEIIAALKRLQDADRTMVPAAHKNIGEYLVRAHRERMAREESPDGSKFAPLSPAYKARKKGTKILTESGRLRDSIVWQIVGNELQVGTNVIYAALHQLGSRGMVNRRIGQALVSMPGPRIPARPFVGLSDEDLTETVAIIQDHLQMTVAGRADPA